MTTVERSDFCWCGHRDDEHRRTGAQSWACSTADCHCTDFAAVAS